MQGKHSESKLKQRNSDSEAETTKEHGSLDQSRWQIGHEPDRRQVAEEA